MVYDSRLGNIEFSPDERRIVYVAEKKITEESFFKKPEDETNDETVGTRFEFNEACGEQLELLNQTCVCVLTIQENCKSKIIELPYRTLARPFWIDNQAIGFVGYKKPSRSLRMVSGLNPVKSRFLIRNLQILKFRIIISKVASTFETP